MAFVVVGAEDGWGKERPWQSSSWVLTPSPAGGGGVETEPRGCVMPRSLIWTWPLRLWTDGRWELCECDESELRAIPWISTRTVTDWYAAAGSSAQLPQGRRSPFVFPGGCLPNRLHIDYSEKSSLISVAEDPHWFLISPFTDELLPLTSGSYFPTLPLYYWRIPSQTIS